VSTRKPPRDSKTKAGKLLAAVVVLILLSSSWFGLLDGPWVGIFVGSIFLMIGLLVSWSVVFGGYDSPWLALVQAPGRLLLGGLLIFLGGLGVVSATSDYWPALVWKQPWFGDLRTLFWGEERFTAMACHYAEEGPPEALRFALERAPQRRLLCQQPVNGIEVSLLDVAETDEKIEMLVAARQYHQADLDRKLIDLCRQGTGRLPAIERLLGAGANPNTEISYETALSAAFDNEQTRLALWLLEHGAQANYTFQNGETLLERTERSGRVDLMPIYGEMLRSHGANEKPKLEQTPPGR
jgi:hypothetical protein